MRKDKGERDRQTVCARKRGYITILDQLFYFTL